MAGYVYRLYLIAHNIYRDDKNNRFIAFQRNLSIVVTLMWRLYSIDIGYNFSSLMFAFLFPVFALSHQASTKRYVICSILRIELHRRKGLKDHCRKVVCISLQSNLTSIMTYQYNHGESTLEVLIRLKAIIYIAMKPVNHHDTAYIIRGTIGK